MTHNDRLTHVSVLLRLGFVLNLSLISANKLVWEEVCAVLWEAFDDVKVSQRCLRRGASASLC